MQSTSFKGENIKGRGGAPESKLDSVSGALDSHYWRLVVDAIPEGITVHSMEGKILYANRSVTDIYGKSVEDLIGISCEEIFHDQSMDCPHKDVLQSGRSIRIDSNLEVAGRSYSITIAPIFDDGGRKSGYVRVMRDITERQRAQEHLLRAERFATLGQMITGIAHDVGTPLNIISGYSEYLLMRTDREAHGYKELSTILQQTRRIAEFIKQMLDLSRPLQGRSDAIGLKGFLAESLNLISHHLRKSEVEIEIICDINPPLIYGDAPRLRQAFFNLLLNASQRIAPKGTIELIVYEDGDRPEVVLVALVGREGDGAGHDFSRSLSGFLSSPPCGEDIGMGLFLAKKILEEFGAEIGIEDTNDRGIGLILYLPVKMRD